MQQRTPPVLSPTCCTVSSGHTEVPLTSHHPNPHLYSRGFSAQGPQHSHVQSQPRGPPGSREAVQELPRSGTRRSWARPSAFTEPAWTSQRRPEHSLLLALWGHQSMSHRFQGTE